MSPHSESPAEYSRPSGEGTNGGRFRLPPFFRWGFRLFALFVLFIAFNAYSCSQAGRVIPTQHLVEVEQLAGSEQFVFSEYGSVRCLSLDGTGPPRTIQDFTSVTPGGGWSYRPVTPVGTSDDEWVYFGDEEAVWRVDRAGVVERVFHVGDLDPELQKKLDVSTFSLRAVDHERGWLYGRLGVPPYTARIELGTNRCDLIRKKNFDDFALSKDGETLYGVESAHGAWQVSARDFAGGERQLLALEDLYTEVDLSPDGKRLLLAGFRNQRPLILDIESGRSESLPAVASQARWLDDDRILFTTGTTQLAEYSLSSRTERKLLRVTGRSKRGHEWPLALSRDRTLVAWTFSASTVFSKLSWENRTIVIFPPKLGTVLIDLERGEFDLLDPYTVTYPNGMTFQSNHAGHAAWLNAEED